jgi:hypothetical protein
VLPTGGTLDSDIKGEFDPTKMRRNPRFSLQEGSGTSGDFKFGQQRDSIRERHDSNENSLNSEEDAEHYLEILEEEDKKRKVGITTEESMHLDGAFGSANDSKMFEFSMSKDNRNPNMTENSSFRDLLDEMNDGDDDDEDDKIWDSDDSFTKEYY